MTVAARKQPRQERSRQLVRAIQQAAAELFAELGYARTTTNKIAARAGVSVGSLYQYFPNKDSLLASLFEQHHREVHGIVEAGIERLADPATPLDTGLRALLGELVALHQTDPALTRALSASVVRESQLDEALIHGRHDDTAQARVVVALLAARPDVRPGDHAVMAAVLGQAIAQLSRWMVHDAPEQLDRGALLDEVVALLVRYLRS